MTGERLGIYWLCQIGVGSAAYGVRTCRRIGVGGHDDDRYLGTKAAKPPQQIEPAVPGHVHIANQAIELDRALYVLSHESVRSIVGTA